MRVLVTGGGGFLGRHVVSELLGRGHAVRVLARSKQSVDSKPWAKQVEVVQGDLRDRQGLEGLFEGVDVVVHAAAQVKGSDEARFAGTVVATEVLLEIMALSSTRRLVLISSFSVYDWSAGATLTEESPVEHFPGLYERDGYAVAKVWQERVVRRMSVEHGWHLTVLRPGFIWGPGNVFLPVLGQKVGKVYLNIAPAAMPPLTHVANCANLVALATEAPQAIGHTFNVVDEQGTLSWRYLVDHMHRSRVRGQMPIPLPYDLARAIVHAIWSMSQIMFHGRGKLPSILVPRRFEARFKPVRCSNRKAREVLGWQPPLDYLACMRHTYALATADT